MSSNVDPIKIRRMLSRVESVPTLPNVVSQLFEVLGNPETSAMDIERIILSDQALTSKVLRVANSAFYGFPRKIASVTQAVVILGFETVRNLALTVSVFGAFDPVAGEVFDRDAFWRHSLACGVIARTIAQSIHRKDSEDVFVMGLLHDVGKVVLDQYFSDEFKQIIHQVHEKNILIIDAEKEVLGLNHTLIGACVAEGWNLPQPIVQSIRYHHTPSSAKEMPKESAMVHIGDVLARTRKFGSGGDNLVPPLRTEALRLLKISPKELAVLAKKVDPEVEKAFIFLESAEG